MELNGDGRIDLLSGCYSSHEPEMGGELHVFWGQKDGSFGAPEVLKGTDGKPLLIPTPGGDQNMTDKICTRPFAADLDGDGKIDIVTGNFSGTFAVFRGEGGGKFAPVPTWLDAGGQRMQVDSHSDPFLVDWDADGDLDLLSGSAAGGAFVFCNEGTKTEPKFAAKKTLVEAVGHRHEGTRFGDAHLTGPQAATRIWVDDVNGDGALDLLLGDQTTLVFPVKGIDEAKAKKQLAEWEKKQTKLFESNNGEMSEARQKEVQKAYEELREERAKIVTDEMTGFVWIMYQQKGAATPTR